MKFLNYFLRVIISLLIIFAITLVFLSPTAFAAKKKQPAAVETSESIEEQTKLFLKSGNKIDIIQSGVSGQPTMAVNKQIKLGNKQKTA